MIDQSKPRKTRWWQIATVILSLAAMSAFLEDIIKADWVAWLAPPSFVAAFFGLLWMLRPASFARGGLWFVAILFLAFVAIYDVLDLILDPIIRSDLLIAAAALVVVAALWSSLSAVIAAEQG